jgi:hypothetical protein
MPKGVPLRHPAEVVAARLGEIERKYQSALTAAEHEAIAGARAALYRIGMSTSRQGIRTGSTEGKQ